ncbi:MAG: hypothetical protein ACTSXZ_00880 [Alphaproteobacteria bacterium]
MLTRVGVLFLVAALLLGVMACGEKPAPATTPHETAGVGVPRVEVVAEGARFEVGPLPAGWKRMQTGGAKAAFRHLVSDQVIMVNVVYAPNRQAGLTALRNHLLFDITSRKILEQESIEIDHREAIWTIVEGRLDGARVKLALLVVRIDEWVYDMVYIAVPERFDLYLDDFQQFIHSFHHQRHYDPME